VDVFRPVAFTTAISLLMNIGGIELVANREIDSNRELKVAGIVNLLIGLAGGILSFHSLSKSVLAYKMGSSNRLATLIGAVVFIGVPLLGLPLLTHFPKPVLGGLLLFLGLSLMGEWVYTAWFKLPQADYWIVQLIWVVSSMVGFLQGLVVGWLVAVVLFMHQYSRLYAIQSGVWGTERQSSAERSDQEQKILQQQGYQLHLMELQGLLFFGTISGLLSKVRKRIAHPMPVRFIILDFRDVPDIDSSVVIAFARIQQMAQRHRITLVFTNLQDTILQKLGQKGCLDTHNSGIKSDIKVFPSLDQGIRWCENRILQTFNERRNPLSSLLPQLSDVFSERDQLSIFTEYLERLHIAEGTLLYRQGDLADGIYFIVSGQVSLILELPDAQREQIETLGAGAIAGEIEIYWNAPRSASLVADLPTCLYRLSNAALKQMEQDVPAIAAQFYQFITAQLGHHLEGHPNSVFHLTAEQPVVLTPAFIERCRKELIYYIGPMANLLIDEAIAKYSPTSPEQLIEVLSAKIPDAVKAYEFQHRLLS
jgi:SulP family sulfate permease